MQPTEQVPFTVLTGFLGARMVKSVSQIEDDDVKAELGLN